MKTLSLLLIIISAPILIQAQPVAKKLDDAIKKFEADPQMQGAIVSLHVINTNTAAVVYSKNGGIGLPTGSTLKVITAATAYELLGSNFRYKTNLMYDGLIENNTLNGNLYIEGSGDPTLGSWRYPDFTAAKLLSKYVAALKQQSINKITGNVYLNASRFSLQPIPGGWSWDDMGNYYGAGVWGLNWRENQYDLLLKPGKMEGDDVQIIKTEPSLQGVVLFNFLKTGKKGSGDNAIIYCAPYSGSGFVEGTVPAGDGFKISGSFPNPVLQLQDELISALAINNINVDGSFMNSTALAMGGQIMPKATKNFYTYLSPSLDTINYWFLRKSINLYGEALLKTLALERKGEGNLDDGIKMVKDFWATKGISPTSINIKDGSGLSASNRVTANALTTVLNYATRQPWYASFFNALPEYNNLKMKSGTIGGTKSFTGYSHAKDGTKYTFAIIVNNYNGSSSGIVGKMYKVLDVLK